MRSHAWALRPPGTGCESWLCHLLAVKHWASYLPVLRLSFLLSAKDAPLPCVVFKVNDVILALCLAMTGRCPLCSLLGVLAALRRPRPFSPGQMERLLPAFFSLIYFFIQFVTHPFPLLSFSYLLKCHILSTQPEYLLSPHLIYSFPSLHLAQLVILYFLHF